MFPVMIFYALNYILQGVLQSLGKFNMPAFVSVPSSLIVIIYVLFLGNRFGVKGLLVATFIGLALQGLILIPPVFKTEYRFHFSFDYKNEDIRKAVKLMFPVLLGTSAYQLNMLFNISLTANFRDKVAIMVFVQNVILYSVLAFIYSITAVVFPKFTMLAAANDMQGFKNSLVKVLKTIIYFLLPATIGFIAVCYPLINFVIGWGKISGDNVRIASILLSLYALGIVGVGIKEVTDRAFYSLKDTFRPAVNGIIIMAVNIIFSLTLIRGIGVYGIPLAYSISSLTGAGVLIYLLRRKIGSFGGKELFVSVLKISAACIFMAVTVFVVNWFMDRHTFSASLIDKGIKLFIHAATGGAVYFAATYLMGVEEAAQVLQKVKLNYLRRI
jgi:putative peptidoglycan lipid II flippase